MKPKMLSMAIVVIVMLASTGVGWCQATPLEALEKAIATQDWEEIDTTAAALEQDPDWTYPAAALRGYAGLARSDFPAAVNNFQKAQAGIKTFKSKSWLRKLLTDQWTNPIAQLLDGDYLQRDRRESEAQQRFGFVLKHHPDFHFARLARITSSARHNLSSGKIPVQDQSPLMASPFTFTADALILNGLTYILWRNYAKARGDLDRVLEIAPNHPILWNTLGLLHVRQGAIQQAVEAFLKAKTLAPELTEANINYGWAIARARDAKSNKLGDFGHSETQLSGLKPAHTIFPYVDRPAGSGTGGGGIGGITIIREIRAR